MTPVPLELPLRPAEAAALANLIFDQAEGKPLTDELRTRLASRGSVLPLSSLVPYFGSLERDPVHPSTYYLAVDGDAGQPLLLHMALANAPTGSLFRKPLLIGRMPRPSGPEMVINCLPFGPAQREEVEKFAARTDPRLLPRPLGPHAAIVVESPRPEVDFPVALEASRVLAKRGGKNLVALAGGPGENSAAYPCGVWAAIRAGWRTGYGLGTTVVLDEDMERVREAIRRSAACSLFTVAMGGAIRPVAHRGALDEQSALNEGARREGEFGPALQAAEAALEAIRRTRSAIKAARSFDFELSLEGSPQPTSPADLRFCLDWMKARGHAVQLAAPQLGGPRTAATELAELAPVARHYGCALSLASSATHDSGILQAIGRATLGRVNYRLSAGRFPAGAADLASAIQVAAAHLFG
jgi:hypothetical protein